jgi:cysteine desulfurase/selenocysteine lyase
MAWRAEDIRQDFPALSQTARGRPVVYLDNACMTLKPNAVVDAIVAYYRTGPGCHGRTDHLFGQRATATYSGARLAIASFLNARHDREVVFTRNATEAINLVARGLDLAAGDVVLGSSIEHNSNLVPWQVLSAERGVRHEVLPTLADTRFDLAAFARRLDSGGVKLVSVVHTSNLTGVTFPVAEICEAAHRRGALVLVDAAQATLTHAIDVRALDADFLALSSHKMLGPTGFGALWARGEMLERLRPLVTGGETVLDTTYESRTEAGAPDRFEAGLQDYAGAAGAGAAAAYVAGLGPERIRRHAVALNTAATEGLLRVGGVRILGPEDPEARGSIVNFTMDGIASQDLSRLLNDGAGIMVRFGRHCVHSWYNATRTPDSVRVSFGPYNTTGEVDLLVEHVGRVARHFR